MTKPLPLWSRSFEASSNINPEVESALSAAAGIALTFAQLAPLHHHPSEIATMPHWLTQRLSDFIAPKSLSQRFSRHIRKGSGFSVANTVTELEIEGYPGSWLRRVDIDLASAAATFLSGRYHLVVVGTIHTHRCYYSSQGNSEHNENSACAVDVVFSFRGEAVVPNVGSSDFPRNI